MNPNKLDVHELAKQLHCSERQVQLYAQAGMPRIRHGRYNATDCQQWFKKQGRGQNGSIAKLVQAARKDRAVIMEFRRILRPLPNQLAPRLLGRSEREISEILQDAFREAVTEFSYEKLQR